MSSGVPNKRMKTSLTDTKQLKLSNFFTGKSVDAATTATSLRQTTKKESSRLNGVFDDYDITNKPYDGDCLFTCLAIRLAKDSALQVRKEVVNYLRQQPDMVRIKQ